MKPFEHSSEEVAQPWYRYPWMWLMVGLPATVVVACLNMVYIAVTHPDSVVEDNYYKEGLAINQRLDQDQQAVQLGLRSVVVIQDHVVRINMTGNLEDWPALKLQLLHPVDESHDRTLEFVSPDENGLYLFDLEQPLPPHRWNVWLSPLSETPSWRLGGSFDLSDQRTLVLLATDSQ